MTWAWRRVSMMTAARRAGLEQHHRLPDHAGRLIFRPQDGTRDPATAAPTLPRARFLPRGAGGPYSTCRPQIQAFIALADGSHPSSAGKKLPFEKRQARRSLASAQNAYRRYFGYPQP